MACTTAWTQKSHALGLEVGQVPKHGAMLHYEWMHSNFSLAVEGGFRSNPYKAQAGVVEYDYYSRTQNTFAKAPKTTAYDAPADYGSFWPQTSLILSVGPKYYLQREKKNSLVIGFLGYLNYLKGFEVADDITLVRTSTSSTEIFSSTRTDYWHLKRTLTPGAERYTMGVSMHLGYQLLLTRDVSFTLGFDIGRMLHGEVAKSEVFELQPLFFRPQLLAKYHW